MKLHSLALAAISLAAGVAIASPAMAAEAVPLADCPMANVPFSIDAPVIDVMLSPSAREVMDKATPGQSGKNPMIGTDVPSFAAILTPRMAARFTGMNEEQLAALDKDLRALVPTEADKVARCARYDNTPLSVVLPAGKPRLLLFEKIVGFKDVPSFNAAHEAIVAMAKRKGWVIVTSDKAGAFTPETLSQFDAVIWNNISGDVLTLSERDAFKAFLENGGGFVGLHGSAGDPVYFWDWYPDTLIGARFKSHPMKPQFQDARIVVNKKHPLAAHLPREWTMKDEWYSFSTNPRNAGANVLLTLDESTYSPVGMGNMDLRMGDHPIAWTNCIGQGRMFYSAIGHLPDTYAQPQNVAMMEDAIAWAADRSKACSK